jgi:hypothetical protein
MEEFFSMAESRGRIYRVTITGGSACSAVPRDDVGIKQGHIVCVGEFFPIVFLPKNTQNAVPRSLTRRCAPEPRARDYLPH